VTKAGDCAVAEFAITKLRFFTVLTKKLLLERAVQDTLKMTFHRTSDTIRRCRLQTERAESCHEWGWMTRKRRRTQRQPLRVIFEAVQPWTRHCKPFDPGLQVNFQSADQAEVSGSCPSALTCNKSLGRSINGDHLSAYSLGVSLVDWVFPRTLISQNTRIRHTFHIRMEFPLNFPTAPSSSHLLDRSTIKWLPQQ